MNFEEFKKKIGLPNRPVTLEELPAILEKVREEGLKLGKENGVSEEKFNEIHDGSLLNTVSKMKEMEKGEIKGKDYFFITHMSRGFAYKIKDFAEELLNIYADKFINVEGGEELRAVAKAIITESEKFNEFIVEEITERCDEIA